nr:hypothetical protein [Tanacetum cinerariifolium]
MGLLQAKKGTKTVYWVWVVWMGRVSQDACISDNWANLEGDQVRIDVSRLMPLGGPPGHVTIQTQFFFNKGSKPALSISKMKDACYPDFGRELLVPKQLWIDDVCTYDISAKYGHLDYLLGFDKHMLSTAVKLWTRNLVTRQRVEDFQLGIESYQIQLNLTKPGWHATGYEFKHDYTIIESPRAVVFPVDNNT